MAIYVASTYTDNLSISTSYMGIRIHIIRVINSVIGLRITYHQSSAVNSRWKFLAWYSLKQVYQLEGSFQDPPTHIAERV